ILSEVQDHDQYLDDTCAYQEEHVMHDSYVKDNDVSVIHSNASSVPNDTFMMIYDDMCEPFAPSVSNSSQNAVVKNSLTTELATYREQVELYERRAKFKLTEREQKINEQLRLVILNLNFKEETLKWELHSTKLQLTSTINRNKSMVEETTFPKQDFKQKENRLLADFLNMKSLKEKVKDRLVKQDQSLQTVHMLCRPRPLYNDLNKVAIGYKNPLCLTRAKQAQPALYNCYEILKDNHARAKLHNTEDTLEIAEITRKKMNAKITDPEYVTHKVKIAPHDYSKENLLATFTPQKQLTPEQIYWSNDLMKLKSEALKERAKVSRPIKAFIVTLMNYWSMRLALVLKAPNNELNSLPILLLLGRSKLLPPNLLIGVKRCPKASGSQPKSNHKTNRIFPAKGANKVPVEDLPRTNKSHLRTTNRVDSSSHLKRTVINSNSDSICQTCNKCLTSFDHDMCMAVYVKSVTLPHSSRHNCEVERKIKRVWKPKHVARKITQV
nr:hypothetical protein [Tanacetum cinerariifolium]